MLKISHKRVKISHCSGTQNEIQDLVEITGLRQNLRPHQFDACTFILANLLGTSESIPNDLLFPLTGAILADDMGTGKTLVGITVATALCRKLSCKCIIVCPTTLVSNWENEIKKWLPSTLGRTALFISSSTKVVSGSKVSDLIVNDFITSHPLVHPVLVLSYEMFRIFAAAFNTMTNLEVIVCDEGHRLKNAYGTKTTTALGNCCAMKRLVLTGTPIQNNLEELYSVVQFAVPGYLGSLKEFKTNYIDPITNRIELHSDENNDNNRIKSSKRNDNIEKMGNEAEQKLKSKLSSIILRRTSDMILKSILPVRNEFHLLCHLSNNQRKNYTQTCDNLFGIIENEVSSDLLVDDDGDENNGIINDKITSAVVKSHNKSMILPIIMQLRMICNMYNPIDEAIDFNNNISSNKSNHIDDNHTKANINYDKIHLVSTKLQIVDDLIHSIYNNCKNEKIVIVSNFTKTLDDVHELIKYRRWQALRIDGNVIPERRMKIVQHFNNPQSPFFIMLLSSKAGGVGLNLIGGNRMILMEPDWNPANDQQAMGRVWRDGQQKPVFIYRLIAKSTIEETILSRQADKSSLSSLISTGVTSHGLLTDNHEAIVENEEIKSIVKLTNLSMKGLKALVNPGNNNNINNNNNNNNDNNNNNNNNDKNNNNDNEMHQIESNKKYQFSIIETEDVGLKDLLNGTGMSNVLNLICDINKL
eukprot:gene5214-7254_t